MTTPRTYHIAFATDERGAGFMAVAIVSLLHNNRDLPLHIHIITDSLSRQASRPLDRISRRYATPVTIHTVDPTALRPLHDSVTYPLACLFRFYLPDILPTESRVLYLDTDTIVNGPLRPLLDTDLGDNVIGAVADQNPSVVYINRQAGLDDDVRHFNSGVMLIDLDRWRRENVTDRCLELLGRRSYYFPDQDVLNRVLQGRVLLLDPAYNAQTRLWYPSTPLAQMDAERYGGDVTNARRHPVIRHYTSTEKPWVHHPLREFAGDKQLWLKYYRMSPRVKLPYRWTFRGVRSFLRFVRYGLARYGVGRWPHEYDKFLDPAWHDTSEETQWHTRMP